jgi:hypothetical protein
MVYDVKQSKPRGYAFIEYENERDMHFLPCAGAFAIKVCVSYNRWVVILFVYLYEPIDDTYYYYYYYYY